MQPPALMLPSALARPFSLDCRQYTMPSPTMIWGGTGGSGGAAPWGSGGSGLLAVPPHGCRAAPGSLHPKPRLHPPPPPSRMSPGTGTHRGGGRGEGQAEQHEQRDELLVGLHVGHGERPVVALEAHLGRLEEVRQLQKVERHDGGGHDGQLGGGARASGPPHHPVRWARASCGPAGKGQSPRPLHPRAGPGPEAGAPGSVPPPPQAPHSPPPPTSTK